ncbi:hypothetical protein NPIL_300691 [Nephila pilipes]|uniref:Uncharacterized protein n=1 Tax=Nephila pilipes TaxID=299642 RepID=A0A8X6N255_NEPPI|nr:hypothetical protein NPIL_300691 [Nephila pilipes]
MMDTLDEEAPGLVVKPFFNSRLDLIIVGKLPSIQSCLEWTEDVVSTRREVRTLRGNVGELPSGIIVTVCHTDMRTSIIMQDD